MRSVGAVIAELISSNRGLGYLVQTGAMNFDTTQVFVAILAAAMVVHAFIALIDLGERSLLALAAARRGIDRRSRDLTMTATPMLDIKGLGQEVSGAGGAASRRLGSSRICRSRSPPASC